MNNITFKEHCREDSQEKDDIFEQYKEFVEAYHEYRVNNKTLYQLDILYNKLKEMEKQ